MAIDRGKQWEQKFREDWERTVPDSDIVRFNDQVSRYAGYSSNISDFMCFKSPELFYIECKTVHGNTLPMSRLTQYDKMIVRKNITGVRPGFIVWWIDHDIVAWVPIHSVEQMKKDNKKSINVKMIKEKVYDIVVIPSVKKRVFMDSDYSVLIKTGE